MYKFHVVYFFDYLIFYRIGRMYMVSNILSYLEHVELTVLNIAKWNQTSNPVSLSYTNINL